MHRPRCAKGGSFDDGIAGSGNSRNASRERRFVLRRHTPMRRRTNRAAKQLSRQAGIDHVTVMRVMRRSAVLRSLGGVACAFAIAGCSNSSGPNLQASSGQHALSGQDRNFLVFAQQSSLAEISAANVALKQSQNSAIAAPITAATPGFAPVMVRDHTNAINQETPIAQKYGVALPGTPLPAAAQSLAQYANLTGTPFDTAYAADQVKSHEMTIAQFNQEISSGSASNVVCVRTDDASHPEHAPADGAKLQQSLP